MPTDFIPQVVDVATRIRTAHRLRAFEHVASEFVRLLGTIPDCAADEPSNTDIMALRRLAEGVIDQIETRLASGPSPAARQQSLASTAYEISRLLGEVNTWRRHYHTKGAAMILLNSVLVATDFGETSRAALDYGHNLARAFGGRLHLLHVVDAVVPTSAAEFYPHGPRDLEIELIDEAKNSLEALLTEADREHLHTVPAVRVSGSVAATIVEYAKQAHVDVIVVGTHGRGAIGHFFLGSVAEQVARTAPCPVLVVRPNEHEFIVPDPVGVDARI